MNNLAIVKPEIVNPVDQTKAFVERESYGFVNTREVLGAFENAGWKPVSTTKVNTRKIEKMGFQKHLISLENDSFPFIEGLSQNNNSKPQLVVVNSHDGTSSLQILWGLFRIACANGIIAGKGINGVRLSHSKTIVSKLPEAIEYMLNNFGTFSNQIKLLQNKQLSDAAIKELVKTLYDARLANVKNVVDVNYALKVNRMQDNGTDAYTVFNRVQETMVRGGIEYSYNRELVDENGKVFETSLVEAKTRRIASVNSQVKLNQLAFDTAMQLAA